MLKIEKSKKNLLRAAAAVSIILMLLSNLAYQWPFYSRLNPYQVSAIKYGTRTFGIAHLFSLELNRRLSGKDGVFVWAAEPEVYFYLGKKALSRYPYCFYWMTEIVAPEKILREVMRRDPRFVILTGYAPPSFLFEKWISGDYNLSRTFMGWKLFERKNRCQK
ncbi:hypothetical protein HZB08_01335 [Candidatus Saganbacteria bacterium]|uniref:Uncharacterized protein n=1 Tax=Candidatus Saganbacteria bacterium TaxID=2575572 RepID=A0A9D6ULW2_UNCSA|nr:hypothetical protein [Candidatus Saganbacteria bacterium]